MRICGVDYQGDDLVPVIIARDDGQWKLEESSPPKITLTDLYDTEEVRIFAKTVQAFMNEHRVDVVAIKKRPVSGRYSGGAASFRMGGVVQVVTEQPVLFVPTRSIDIAVKRHGLHAPPQLYKYQEKAYQVAMTYALAET